MHTYTSMIKTNTLHGGVVNWIPCIKTLYIYTFCMHICTTDSNRNVFLHSIGSGAGQSVGQKSWKEVVNNYCFY